MNMKVLGEAADWIGHRSETQRAHGRLATHPDKGAYGADAGQQSCLNSERDLWRERGG